MKHKLVMGAFAALALLMSAGCQTAKYVASESAAATHALRARLRDAGEVAKTRAAMTARLRRENEERLRLNALTEEVMRLLNTTLVAGDPIFANLTVGETRFSLPPGPGEMAALLVVSSRSYPDAEVVVTRLERHSRVEYRPPGTIRPYVFELQEPGVVATCVELCPNDEVVLVPLYRP